MISEDFDIEKNIQCIEKNLLTFHKNDSDFSKAICNVVLHLAKKESKNYVTEELDALIKLREEKPDPDPIPVPVPIPDHFISLHNFCYKWGWPRSTVKHFLKKNKFPAYNHPSVSMYTLERVYEDKWFVDEKRILKTISSLGETTSTRNRAFRNLELINKMEKLTKKEQKLNEKEERTS